MPTYLSLFSGIGGLDRAVESLGYRCVGQVENDDHCSRVLERHWPDVRRWRDVHDFTAASYTERGSDELRRGSVHLASAAADPEGEGDQRQRSGGTAGSDRERVGDAYGSPDLIIGGFP